MCNSNWVTRSLRGVLKDFSNIVFVANFSASFDTLGVFTADCTAGVLLTTSLPNDDEDEDTSAMVVSFTCSFSKRWGLR